MIKKSISSYLILGILFMDLLRGGLSAAPEPIRVGVLQARSEQAGPLANAGVTLAVLSISWDRFEPSAGTSDQAYIRRMRADCDAFQRAGIRIVLDPGFQYPPAWLLDLPNSRYQNQHGDLFIDGSPGKNIPNSVFNANIRERQAEYLRALFRELGTDFHAVRLGGGWYNELNYPPAIFNDQSNCYWAFDAIAQGLKSGLPAGLSACPVPGWKPGSSSPDHVAARHFLDWYLASLKNYHDWQIATVRMHYAGPLMMMYPSWGIRPGQTDAAIAGDLSGHTPPEKNGEIQRGFDFARFIGDIRDPKVGIHCTWLDSSPSWSDESSIDPSRWSPVHYLSSLARQHTPPLVVSAENTGGGSSEILHLCAERASAYEVKSVFWAFAPDLFDGRPPELKDLAPAFAEPGAVLWANPIETGADFTSGDGMGSLEKQDGRTAVRISQTDGTTSALRTMKVPVEAVRGKWVYLSADVKGADISTRPQDWNGVKVMLKVDSPSGTQWPQIGTPAGAFDWRRMSTRILIPADAAELTLHLGLELVTGTAWFDNLAITLAREVREVPAARADQPVFKGHSLSALRGAMAHPQMKREDLRVFAEEWGGNLIRWQLLHLPKPGTEHDYEAYDRWLEQELTKLDEVLKWAEELGVMLVVDLHSPPGGRISGGNIATASGDFWGTAAAQAHFIQVWQRIASRYKGASSAIWGFDLLNEPDDRTVTPDGSDWQTLASRAAKAVRETDPQRTLIIEPAMGGSAEGFTGFEPIDLPNIVYSFHMYTPFTYTHQGVDSPIAPIVYPGQIDGKHWDKAAMKASMMPAVEFARKYRVHLYVGEFSTIRWSPGADTYLTDAIDIFESHGWDWTYHAFREWHGWNLELGADRNDMTPEKSPNARLKALQKWTRQNQRAAASGAER